jgi:DHA1 family bicyclomycin/chloramphenicol resistance-like MFS transporter
MVPLKTDAATRPLPGFGEFVAMMATLMALTALSIDVMLPALPHIRDEFGLADPNRQQLVVTAYLLGFALGQLFTGPLSDRLGRRPVLLTGLAVYAFAAFACVVSGSFEMLLAARLLQGVANAGPRIVAIAVVRDLYGGRRMAEVMSFVMMVFIIVPVVAPSVGSLIMFAGSWHLIFALLALIALLLFGWMGLRLPETGAAVGSMPPGWLGAALSTILRSRLTIGYALATGVILGSLMGYINSAQQIFVDVYGLGDWFPVVFGAAAMAMAVASFVNSQLVMRLGMRRIGHAALLGYVAVSTIMLGLVLLLGALPLAVFVGLFALDLFCFGLVMPNFNAIAMEPMGRIAGTASSFIGAVTTVISALLGLVIGQQFDGSVRPLIVGFAGFGLLTLTIVLITERGRLFRQRA